MIQTVVGVDLATQEFNFYIMMKPIYVIVIFSAALLFTQCRSGRMITKAIAPKDSTKIIVTKTAADSLALVESTRADIKKNYISYKTFSAKIKMDIEDNKGKKPDLLAVVRIIKDSAIWISVSATILNLEVYRAYITKDSVVLLNKQDREVTYRSLDYLQEVTKIPFDFKTLQDLFVGNVVFFDDTRMTVKKYEDLTLAFSAGNLFKNLITINSGDKLLQHSKLDDADPNRSRTADFTYDGYSSSNGINFSTYREIVVSEKNKIDIRMNYKQFEFNKDLSLPFTVPKNYKRN